MSQHNQISEDLREAVSRLLKSKDWLTVSQLIDAEIESIKDISEKYEGEKDISAEAKILGREIAYRRLQNFLTTLSRIAGIDRKEVDRWD